MAQHYLKTNAMVKLQFAGRRVLSKTIQGLITFSLQVWMN